MRKFDLNTLIRRGAALVLSGSLVVGLTVAPFPAWAATTHNKIGDGTYQLLDGTAITGIVARGIDISHWQGAIDWKQVAQDDISFAMLGTRYKGAVDPMFHTNAKNAAAAGINLGAYIYSYATDVAGAEAEADFILDLIKDYPISYPIAFDIEDSSQASLSPTEISNMINAFCRKIEAAGYHPMVYANDYWLANKIDLSQVKYDVWVARYEVKHVFEHPVMWQATSSGKVSGVNGGVDIDFQYKDFSEDIPANLWRTIGDKTYYYQNYVMQKNTWIHDGTGWFYMNGDGQAATGWLQTGNTWYFLRDSGAMVTGWRQIGDVWYYFDGSGAMLTGSHQIGDNWYSFDDNGGMLTDWQQINGNWYYFDESGAMTIGWLQHEGNWYYLDPANGIMAANTEITVDGVTYQVDASGVCRAAEDSTGNESSEVITIIPFGS